MRGRIETIGANRTNKKDFSIKGPKTKMIQVPLLSTLVSRAKRVSGSAKEKPMSCSRAATSSSNRKSSERLPSVDWSLPLCIRCTRDFGSKSSGPDVSPELGCELQPYVRYAVSAFLPQRKSDHFHTAHRITHPFKVQKGIKILNSSNLFHFIRNSINASQNFEMFQLSWGTIYLTATNHEGSRRPYQSICHGHHVPLDKLHT